MRVPRNAWGVIVNLSSEHNDRKLASFYLTTKTGCPGLFLADVNPNPSQNPITNRLNILFFARSTLS